MTLLFWGESDDLLEWEERDSRGDPTGRSDEVGCYDEIVIATVGDASEGVVIVAEYGPGTTKGAVWRLSAEQIDEDVPVPWSIEYRDEHSYSLTLAVDCPPGTPIQIEKRSAKRRP